MTNNTPKEYTSRLYLAFAPKMINGKEFFEILAIFSNIVEARKYKGAYNKEHKDDGRKCWVIYKKVKQQVQGINVVFSKDKAKVL